ncbi:hypothetical protein DFH09DRAFT_1409625 [Mycena vulgaris]|nr:hypothetical protein DFH09DRAFT_1409625 [Mycena vulgaris]
MATNVAIVDERDPLVHYAGAWNDGGVSEEFDSTTRWSAIQGSTASFTFVGSSVAVFGTVAALNPPQSSLTFLVDNSIQGTYTPPANMPADIHHEELWASPTLSSGSHTLVITQTAAQAAGVIFLDYIMYNTTSAAGPYFIDDRDPRVVYTPPWQKFGSDPDFMHTSQGTTAKGDSLSLQFEGRSISFYGGINNGSITEVLNASMTIDGGPPVFFVPPIQPAAVTTNNLIFNSGDLPDGKHTLVVTAQNEHTVWADYFLVTPNLEIATSTAPFPTSSGTGTSSSSNVSGIPTAAPKKSSHTAAIAASVVGVLALIALLVVAFVVLRRMKRRRDLEPADLPTTNALASPFAGGAPSSYSGAGAAPGGARLSFSGENGPRVSYSGAGVAGPSMSYAGVGAPYAGAPYAGATGAGVSSAGATGVGSPATSASAYSGAGSFSSSGAARPSVSASGADASGGPPDAPAPGSPFGSAPSGYSALAVHGHARMASSAGSSSTGAPVFATPTVIPSRKLANEARRSAVSRGSVAGEAPPQYEE